MENPFFQIYLAKLKMYRELKNEDVRLRNDALWEMQKAFLQWTTKRHRQLSTNITPEFVNEGLLEHLANNHQARFTESDIENLSPKLLSELAQRKYADDCRNPGHPEVDLAQINDRGVLAGQLLNEKWSKLKYQPIVIFVCGGFIVGILTKYSYAVKFIAKFWQKIF